MGFLEGGFPPSLLGFRPGKGERGVQLLPPSLCTLCLNYKRSRKPSLLVKPRGPTKGFGLLWPNAQPCPAPPRPGPLLQASFCLERPHLLPSFFTGSEFSEPLHQFAAHSPGKPGTQLPVAQMEETEARVSPGSPHRLWGCLCVIYKLPRSLEATSHPSQFVADAARPWRKWGPARSRVSSTEVSPEMNRGGA